MGIYHTKKCLLMDENDFSREGFDPALEIDDLAAEAESRLTDLAGDEEYGPIVEFLGLVSERYDTAYFEPSEFDPEHLKDDWRSTLNAVVSGFGSLDEAEAERFADSEDINELKQQSKIKLREAVEADDFHTAYGIIHDLLNLDRSGIPGVMRDIELTCGGNDAAYDVRNEKYARGTRLIAEFAVAWP